VAERKHITRGLRFTLATGYTIVFTLLLVGVSLFFRERLQSSLEDQSQEGLRKSWAVVAGFLRIERAEDAKYGYKPEWFSDPDDPEEGRTVAIVKGVLYVADAAGHPLESSQIYQSLGPDSVAQINTVLQRSQPVYLEKRDPKHVLYLVRQFYVYDNYNHSRKFFVAIGTSLAHD
jgi:hypothetical protein